MNKCEQFLVEIVCKSVTDVRKRKALERRFAS